MYDASQGRLLTRFAYPDLLTWKSPKAEVDYVGKQRDGWYLAGLGAIKPSGRPFKPASKQASIWQWFTLAFGQSVLVKRRSEPSTIKQSSLPFNDAESIAEKWLASNYISIDDACIRIIKSGFKPETVGEMILKIAEGKNGVKRSAELAAAIARARADSKR